MTHPVDVRAQAKELIMKAKLYRLIATVFAVLGLIIFIILYAQYSKGGLLQTLSSLYFVLIIFIPFLPAALLSWLARRTEKKLYKLVYSDSEETKSAAKKKK